MDASILPKLLVPAAIGGAFAALRRYFPARDFSELDRTDHVSSERFPQGAFAAATVTLGITIAVGGYFGLAWTNHLFGRIDGPALLQLYPVSAIWFFLPGFAALAIPWPLTIALLRRSRFRDDAAYIEREGSRKSGFDCYRVMLGMVLFLVVPVALFTFLALPERLTLGDSQILWTHYAHLRPEKFAYSDARRATLVDGISCATEALPHIVI